jgi:hypothetical protein
MLHPEIYFWKFIFGNPKICAQPGPITPLSHPSPTPRVPSLVPPVAVKSTLQRTCVDKILALGGCPPKDLKIGEEWGPEVLNLRLFVFSFKRPRHPNDL